jgi:hypothetical protein
VPDPATEPLFYLWEVMASEPDNMMGARHGYANRHVFVVTTTMERAIELVAESYPGARFHRVERRNTMGKPGVIIDPEAIHD